MLAQHPESLPARLINANVYRPFSPKALFIDVSASFISPVYRGFRALPDLPALCRHEVKAYIYFTRTAPLQVKRRREGQ
jgi:hypothetical protein